MACYVVLAPEPIRGIYDTWPTCEAIVRGVRGAIYRKAADRALAEQLLRGEGRKLEPGTYAFIDGNAAGGIGVVIVERGGDGSTAVREFSTSVAEAFPEVASALPRLRNPLAEIAGVWAAVEAVRPGAVVTVVHDYDGTAPLVTGRWNAHDPAMKAAVRRCRAAIESRLIVVRFEHTNGHQSAVGGDEYAQYNARADALARQAADAVG
jgi:ribonuclease HI